MSVNSRELTCRVSTRRARWVIGQNAASSRSAGRDTSGAAPWRISRSKRSKVIPGTAGLK